MHVSTNNVSCGQLFFLLLLSLSLFVVDNDHFARLTRKMKVMEVRAPLVVVVVVFIALACVWYVAGVWLLNLVFMVWQSGCAIYT
jgi:hypothetical protein